MAKKNESKPKKPIGRPRTTTPCDEELIKLGEELVQWATEDVPRKEKLKRLRFADWYSLKKGMLRKEWDLLCEKPIFQVYYEQTRNALANNYVDGTISPSIAHRFMRHYCPEVKQEENELIAYEARVKADKDKEVADEYKEKFDATLDQLKKLRDKN